MSYLYIFQIGPVQSFIAAARRTQDLYVGSRMLSILSAAGVIEAANASGFQPIFPYFDKNGKLPEGVPHLPEGVPHRFAFIADETPETLAQRVDEAVKDTWRRQFVARVQDYLVDKIGGGKWEEAYLRQTENWLEFNWAAVAYNPADHSASYKEASALLAGRRALRDFKQVEEDGHKCTLTGAQSQLALDWDKLRQAIDKIKGPKAGEMTVRPNEKLGAIALIKRFAGKEFADCGIDDQKFPSTDDIAGVEERDMDKPRGKEVTGYLAVLHMDGDKMGKRISECKTLQEHQAFSARLAQFADQVVRKTVEGYKRAVLIYAGGDDVLALLPLNVALKCADELRQKFAELTKCNASAGISVTPYNLPLDNALAMARSAEKTAKEGYGRNAVVITEAHGTGQQRQSGAQWDIAQQSIVQVTATVQNHIKAGNISGKIGYEIAEMARQLGGVPELRPAREADLKRLITRRIDEGVQDKKTIIDELHRMFVALGESEECGWESLANWIIYARFLASEGKVS